MSQNNSGLSHNSVLSQYYNQDEIKSKIINELKMQNVNQELLNLIQESASILEKVLENIYRMQKLAEPLDDNKLYSAFMRDVQKEINSFIITGGKRKKTFRKKTKRNTKTKFN
jgi:hypothetical protein